MKIFVAENATALDGGEVVDRDFVESNCRRVFSDCDCVCREHAYYFMNDDGSVDDSDPIDLPEWKNLVIECPDGSFHMYPVAIRARCDRRCNACERDYSNAYLIHRHLAVVFVVLGIEIILYYDELVNLHNCRVYMVVS